MYRDNDKIITQRSSDKVTLKRSKENLKVRFNSNVHFFAESIEGITSIESKNKDECSQESHTLLSWLHTDISQMHNSSHRGCDFDSLNQSFYSNGGVKTTTNTLDFI